MSWELMTSMSINMVFPTDIHENDLWQRSVSIVRSKGSGGRLEGWGSKFQPKKCGHNIGGCSFIDDASMNDQILNSD